MLEPAARHQQLKLYFNSEGEPVAYVAWAFLTQAVAERILCKNDLTLHASEWNEGQHLWIIDLLVIGGHFPYVCRALREQLFRQADALSYFRKRNGVIAATRVSHRQAENFFINRCVE
jgi:hemolysin-activating ACP:hemolysin acyltransferase